MRPITKTKQIHVAITRLIIDCEVYDSITNEIVIRKLNMPDIDYDYAYNLFRRAQNKLPEGMTLKNISCKHYKTTEYTIDSDAYIKAAADYMRKTGGKILRKVISRTITSSKITLMCYDGADCQIKQLDITISGKETDYNPKHYNKYAPAGYIPVDVLDIKYFTKKYYIGEEEFIEAAKAYMDNGAKWGEE